MPKVIGTPDQGCSREILADFHAPQRPSAAFLRESLPAACPGSLGSKQASLQSKLSWIKKNLSHIIKGNNKSRVRTLHIIQL